MPVLHESIYVGSDGINKSWQAPFAKECKCEKCNQINPLTFVYYEGTDETTLASMKPEEFKEWWFHDAVAFATYICLKCWHATVNWNLA